MIFAHWGSPLHLLVKDRALLIVHLLLLSLPVLLLIFAQLLSVKTPLLLFEKLILQPPNLQWLDHILVNFLYLFSIL